MNRLECACSDTSTKLEGRRSKRGAYIYVYPKGIYPEGHHLEEGISMLCLRVSLALLDLDLSCR